MYNKKYKKGGLMQSIKATFTLPDYLIHELSEFAYEFGEKKSHIVTEALNQYFDTLDLKLALKRSEEIKDGKIETISLDTIKEDLGI
jgi:predicted DNA-binding protein